MELGVLLSLEVGELLVVEGLVEHEPLLPKLLVPEVPLLKVLVLP